MQPSLQTTPATYTSTPSTSQESVCNDYDVCQHQETSKVYIGKIFYKTKLPKEFSYATKTLTMSEKYHLLTIPKEQLKENAFPTQYLAGCNRSFRLEWLSQHPWMMYSELVDGVFCTACAIFCSDASKSKFVTKPFRKWNKNSEKVKEHEHSTHHRMAMEQENNVLVMNMRGQGYDGASNISSSTSGVQGRIKKEAPLATYVHCNGHCLNIVISKSCALPQVRKVIECLKIAVVSFLKVLREVAFLSLLLSTT